MKKLIDNSTECVIRGVVSDDIKAKYDYICSETQINHYPNAIYMLNQVANFSKDPNTKVGAMIIDIVNGTVVIHSVGYNHMVCDSSLFNWSRENDDKLLTKYPYVVHAEPTAIINAYKQGLTDLEYYSLMVSLFPCSECAKLIVESGIKTVFYKDDKYNGTQDNFAAKLIFNQAGVEYLKL